MTDEVENSESVVVAPAETTEEHVEAPSTDNQANVRKEENWQEKNWKMLRQRQEELEREVRRKDEMLEKLVSLQTSQRSSEPEEPEVPDDEFATYGKAKKAAYKAVAPLEKKIQELEARLTAKNQSDLLHDLRRKYTDFEDIVNAETLSLLEEKEPELAASIAETKDPYKMGIQSYKYIKALKLTDQAPERRHAKEVEKKAEKNAKSVQSPTAFDKRPMAQAFRMTDQERSALYEEMTSFARLAGSAPEMT